MFIEPSGMPGTARAFPRMRLTSPSLRLAYDFLLEQRFFTVALPSAAACTLLAGRFVGSATHEFRFMAWNLFLAWVPYACSFAAAAIQRTSLRQRGVLVALAGAAWLAFLPNAPYLVTDLFRLRSETHVPLFYDVAMLAMFAWSGCILGATSLHTMRRVLEEALGTVAAHVAALFIIGLSGLGIYLGRVVRLNSWDLALRPHDVLAHAAGAVQSREGVLLTLLFSGFFFVCYATMTAPRAATR
jgi:uncharacterized membrane protein